MPLMRCVSGSMNSCTGSLNNGTGDEMCTPVSHNLTLDDKEIPFFDGVYALVNISKEDVGKFKDPFATEITNDKGDEAFVRVDQWMLVALCSMATVAVMML
ncbi:uncharacterized protein BDZ99DRAFT_457488 [Mytilinidion resinicola]|uniref:Uncharacterized protein n=1 Tax=Mytilinidion resinicola TaxID=574789 RepID=A0A6A6Z9G5_9PEZI|nr:uncharacterized protein BDZ99DRAFT_457488 [Mytilinidion resinicola]KAF2817772.1 hypothetical protein BDZ99DRAFT_457488 [Mytilinidion resinicola]